MKVNPVDCASIPIDPNAILVTFQNDQPKPFVASLSKWSWTSPERTVNGVGNVPMLPFLEEMQEGEIYIDVGANIGQTSMPALVRGIETYAFDPIEYDIRRICEGHQTNLQRGHATTGRNFHLYRTLVGNELKAEAEIYRPEEGFGKFEQSSLYANRIGVVRKPKLVTEIVPMVTLDYIIPEDKPIGLVKIDVQGAELIVVHGMTKILSRSKGYPPVIFYEEQARGNQRAGVPTGMVQKFLENNYGYTCQRLDRSDIVCRKPRAGQTN